ncbi:MAG: deoxyribodipyrimidine photo-lyase [Saprospiraceae bacterium]|nr:deoxyribodipyrimidine photo-lyase [Saprospiraceae bacterium]
MAPISIFWFRRDLRLNDNAGFYHALRSGRSVLPLFIFDRTILDELENRQDARVTFIHRQVVELKRQLQLIGAGLLVYHGEPAEVWKQIVQQWKVEKVYTNRDYEPYATRRDAQIKSILELKGISFETFKDHVIFDGPEVLKSDGTPYTVFTPYSRRWLEKLANGLPKVELQKSFFLKSFPTERYFENLLKINDLNAEARQLLSRFPTLETMGFRQSDLEFPPITVASGLIRAYDKTRDFPAKEGTSKLGIHFRFGTISIREKARKALDLNLTFLNELIWRDFYSQILFHFPKVATHSFRPEYDRIQWRNNPGELQRWKMGQTGYPIVDAGMRQLNETGYMHNRVRMITASFLTKHLLHDWRLGEAYFAEKLLDYDLASNNGGWQWAAGCGTDAAPYFRIFNPSEQTKKFDPSLEYIRHWVPEFGSSKYPTPMVDHVFARNRCLETYKNALK